MAWYTHKSAGDVRESADWNDLIDFLLGASSATQVIDAAGDTILANARSITLNPDADYTMTSTPTIADATNTGEWLFITCANAEGFTITLQDQDTLGGSNLQLLAPLRTITGKEIMLLRFDGTDWVEMGSRELGALLISEASPFLYMKNLTAEDADGGRESTIAIKGIQSGAEETTLGWIRISHSGAGDDEKGKIEIYLNDGSDGDTPTLQMTLDELGTLLLAGGVIALTETTTPGAVAGTGKFYTKNDNNYYFQDGAGVERRVVLSDFAGIYVDENAVATTILLVDAFEPVTVFDTDMPELISNGAHGTDNITIGETGVYEISISVYGESAGVNKDYEFFVFEIAASGDAVSGATQANPCVITATGHSFSDGNRVKIDGVGGMTELNGQIYTVANAGVNDFELNDDNAANINSGAYGAYATPGTAYLATRLDQAHFHRRFAGPGDVGAASSSGFASLTLANTLELHVKGITDASDVTVEGAQFSMKRV